MVLPKHFAIPPTTYSAHAARPTHRSQISQLDRFGLRRASAISHTRIFVEDTVFVNKEISLPSTPPMVDGSFAVPKSWLGDKYSGRGRSQEWHEVVAFPSPYFFPVVRAALQMSQLLHSSPLRRLSSHTHQQRSDVWFSPRKAVGTCVLWKLPRRNVARSAFVEPWRLQIDDGRPFRAYVCEIRPGSDTTRPSWI